MPSHRTKADSRRVSCREASGSRGPLACALGIGLLLNAGAVLADPATAVTPGQQVAHTVVAARLTLVGALRAAEPLGSVLSGHFEAENGRVRVVIWIRYNATFKALSFDPDSGHLTAFLELTDSTSVTVARAQSQIVERLTMPLAEAVADALGTNPGCHAVSVVPTDRERRAVARIDLFDGMATRTVEVEKTAASSPVHEARR